MFYVLFVCKCVLPPGNNPIAVNKYISSFHLVVCLMTGPKPLPKRALHIMPSRASSFKWKYPLLSLRSSNSFLRLLACHPVTSIPPCIFPSVTRCRRQFRRKMWLIQFAFRLRISCRLFLCSLTLSNTSSLLTYTRLKWVLSNRMAVFMVCNICCWIIQTPLKHYWIKSYQITSSKSVVTLSVHCLP